MENWRTACLELWGGDWIAPLSEILNVNRRTVERWNSGAVDIPPHIAAELARLPRLGPATLAYGEFLRRMARGETLEDIAADLSEQRRALARLQADTGRFSVIEALAVRRE